MKRFSNFSKPAFWSQFLLGLVAMLSLPAISPAVENVSPTVVERQVSSFNSFSLQKAERVQAQRPLWLPQTFFSLNKQAVEFCEFFAKPYRLLGFSQPPIRAGPVV